MRAQIGGLNPQKSIFKPDILSPILGHKFVILKRNEWVAQLGNGEVSVLYSSSGQPEAPLQASKSTVSRLAFLGIHPLTSNRAVLNGVRG